MSVSIAAGSAVEHPLHAISGVRRLTGASCRPGESGILHWQEGGCRRPAAR